MEMECVNRCEFMRFGEGKFICKLYDNSDLTFDIRERHTAVERCRECVDEGEIGTNSVAEAVRKSKQYLGWILDSFYSFKDDFESNSTELYRILKDLEDKYEGE